MEAETNRPTPVPVQVATAGAQNVPVFVTALGTVRAFNTVTVRTRVDGELQQVLFDEGQDVSQGQLLAIIDPRAYEAALQQANARLQQDSATLSNAQLNLDRDSRLGKDDFVSTQTIDNEKAQVAQLTAQVAQDKAAITSASVQLSYTRITSPISGRAGLRLVDQGNIVHATDTTGLVVINQLHPIAAISALPQDSIAAVRNALSAGTTEAVALSREDGQVLATGSVALIDNQIDTDSGTVKLKSVFPNADDALWPGQFVDVRIRVGTLDKALTVPAGALQRGPDGTFVYAVTPDNRAQQVPVTVGQIADGIAVIKSGLAEGQPVITAGQYRVRPGSAVSADATDEGAK
ncbi:efflux RND transporter periplasmic adaptor subunit [Azorhizobium oxalatiphilum]|uniref:efflux RND transporter periplasmic adaptor subunit n=1 Tax=Azorhizobium oxalatiphilum TaxID=980631 RepID=UPI001FCECE76|nr:efflux RND transporter periplasmic adaptor subunit [Azorhizobium oxalatiphilum]